MGDFLQYPTDDVVFSFNPLSFLLSLTLTQLFTTREVVSVSCCELNQREESTLPPQQASLEPEESQ